MRKFFLLLTNPKKYFLSLFDDKQFYNIFINKMPDEIYTKIVKTVLMNIEDFVNENKAEISKSFLESIPKNILLNTIDLALQESKKEKEKDMHELIDTIKTQLEKSIKAREEYEKRFDYTNKTIGDKVRPWDVASMSDVETGESIGKMLIERIVVDQSSAYDDYTSIIKEYLSDLGDCIVSDDQVNDKKVEFLYKGELHTFPQNLEIYSKKLDKKFLIDSKHLNLIN